MGLSRAEIQRRHRARKRAGLRRVVLYFDDAEIEDRLINRGYLSRQDADDPAKVAAAFRAAVGALIAPPAEPDDHGVTVTPGRLDVS